MKKKYEEKEKDIDYIDWDIIIILLTPSILVIVISFLLH